MVNIIAIRERSLGVGNGVLVKTFRQESGQGWFAL